jgi:hypothetical protein
MAKEAGCLQTSGLIVQPRASIQSRPWDAKELNPGRLAIRCEVEHVSFLATREHDEPPVTTEPVLTVRDVFPSERS